MSIILFNEFDADVRTIVDADENGDLLVRHEHEVSPIIDLNTKIRNANGKGFGRNKDDLRWIARIPMTLLHEMMRQGIVSEGGDGWHVLDQKRLRGVLNDRDFRGLRTSEGKV